MNYSQACAYINSFINYEHVHKQDFPRTFNLKRMEKLLSLLGNPHKKLKIVHVAGTKGKGSTAAMLAHILHESGYKTGLYTSPHINNFRERIRILNTNNVNNEDLFSDMLSEESFVQCITEMKPAIYEMCKQDDLGVLSFFEIFTAVAFYYFYKSKTDCVVVETGLGGRLDATNVADSLVAVLTHIDLEHTHVLGETLAEIAQEKVAIVKTSEQSVVVAPQESEALDVIKKHCTQMQCEPIYIKESDISDGVAQGLKYQEFEYEGEMQSIPLLGKYQVCNAITACSVVKVLNSKGFSISKEAINKGLAAVQWPIRFEVVQVNPTIILDAAHTVSSARSLVKVLKELFPTNNIKLIAGFSEDKNVQGICEHLKMLGQDVILTQADHLKSREISEEEADVLFKGKCVTFTKTVKDAIDSGLNNLKNDDVLIITGSVFVAAQARGLLCTNTKV